MGDTFSVLRKLSLKRGEVGTPLQITSHPKSQIVDRGSTAVFSVTATSPAGLSYKWFRNGVEVGGETSSTLTVNNAQYVNAGKYYVRITDAAGGVLNSSEARLHVNSTPAPVLSVSANEVYPVQGQPVTFDASMDISPSPGPVYYQWRWNGVSIPNPNAQGKCATSDNQTYKAYYTIDEVQCATNGEYSVVFTNVYWKVASPGVQVTVTDATGNPIPQVTVTATGVPITKGQNPPTLTAKACFKDVCAQWYRTDEHNIYFKELIPGATGMQYTFPDTVPCAPGTTEYSEYFMVEVFDEGRVPHASTPVRVYGDCQLPEPE